MWRKAATRNLLINVYKQLTARITVNQHVKNVAINSIHPQRHETVVHMLKTHLGCLTKHQVIPLFGLQASS
jgi:hypothetical protein